MSDTATRRAEAQRAREEAAEKEALGFFESYADYNKILRTWFVSFGLGGPALFLVNDKLGERLAVSRLGWVAILLFVLGCVTQVFIAFVNKNCAYYNFLFDDDDDDLSPAAKFWMDMSLQYWMDVVADVATGVFYIAALAILLWVFLFEVPLQILPPALT